MPLQIRRGTDAERIAMTQPLAAGELLWTTDQQRLYIGNGSTLPSSLVSVTGYTDENAQDAAASLLTAGTHTGISFTYGTTQDGANRIDATVNLSNYAGTIKADAFKGTLVGDDSVILIDAVSGKINLDGTVQGNIIPSATETYDIGSSSYKFKDLYLSGSSIHLGSAVITASGSAVDLPAGSTINGSVIGTATGEGVIEGSTYKINIAADDSSIIVDATAETVSASGGFFGPLTGNVTGDVSGNAGTVTNGVYTSGSYSNPSWITSLAGSKISGTITGNLIGNVTGDLTGVVFGTLLGDSKGSVFADDSTLMVDGENRIFYGTSYAAGTTTLSSGSLTASIFELGSTSSVMNLTLNLDNNLQVRNAIDGVSGKYVTLNLSRGTLTSPTAVVAGDELGGITIKGFTNSSTSAVAGTFGFLVDPTAVIAGGSYVKSQAFISAATDSGQNSADALLIDSAGISTSNAFVANKYMKLPVFANDAARSSAIPTPTTGMMVFMTSGTSPTVTNKAVIYDSTAWVALH